MIREEGDAEVHRRHSPALSRCPSPHRPTERTPAIRRTHPAVPTLDYQRPSRQPRPPGVAFGCLAVVLTYVGLPALFYGSFTLANGLLQRAVINIEFGPHAYAGGLRMVGPHGEMNDGRRLPAGLMAVLMIGTYLVVMPVCMFCYIVLSAFGLVPTKKDKPEPPRPPRKAAGGRDKRQRMDQP